MKTRILASILLLALVAPGCEKKTPTPESVSEEEAAAEPVSGPIAIEDLQVGASQSTMMTEGAPAKDAIEAELRDALYAFSSFDSEGSRTMSGRVTYDVRMVEERGKSPSVDVVFFGEFEEKTPDVPRKISAEVQATGDPADGVKELVSKALATFAEQVDGQARVYASNDSELLDYIANPNEPSSARLKAVQEARDRRLTGAGSTIEALLDSNDDRLRVAAASALVAFERESAYGRVIGLAEEFSRDRNPQLMPVLYIVGDIDTDASRTYLQTVAEAHSEPAVRAIAQEALGRPNPGQE